jgi:NADPH-dependent 2,4-dienoyl-CoA reductase/sulfur reductase-like enzyme
MTRVGIVGGGVAGVAAAIAASRNGAEVTVYERKKCLPPPRNEWPSLLAGVSMASAERETESLIHQLGVRLYTGTQVKSIDQEARISTQQGSIRFDEAVAATGRRNRPERIPGWQLRGVHVLDELDSFVVLGDALGRYARVVISGSGPLALDITRVLVQKHLDVTIITPTGIMGSLLSEHLRGEVEKALEHEGVRIAYARPTRVAGMEIVEAVIAEDLVHPCDALIVLPATAPNPPGVTAAVGRHGGIVVDAEMRSSQRKLLAAGGCSELTFGSATVCFTTESSARAMGYAAGVNSNGGHVSPQVVGCLHKEFFEIGIVVAGLSLAEATTAGFCAKETTFLDASGRLPACSIIYDGGTKRVCGVQFAGRRARLYAQLAPLVVSSSPRLDELVYHEFPTSNDISPLAEAARDGLD